jgi:oleandomycin transport system permease protein
MTVIHPYDAVSPPMAGGMRPQRRFALARHSLVLARRSLVKTRRNPGGLGDAVLLPVIFLVMFVYLFGGAVSGSSHKYLQYAFPGVLVMTMMIAGMMATGVNLNIDIKQGVFDRFRSLPIARSAPLIGSVLGDMIRYVLALGALFGMGFALGFRVTTGALPALADCGIAIIFGFCISWGYVLAGVAIERTSTVQSVIMLTMFPLAFGTSMVAPTSTMPGWLQAFVKANPVSQVVDASRGLLLGGPVAHPVIESLLWSAGILVVFGPLAAYAYQRRTSG